MAAGSRSSIVARHSGSQESNRRWNTQRQHRRARALRDQLSGQGEGEASGVMLGDEYQQQSGRLGLRRQRYTSAEVWHPTLRRIRWSEGNSALSDSRCAIHGM